MREKLKSYINRYVKMEPYEIDLIFSSMSFKRYKRKEFLLKQDDVCEERFFIIEGLVRSFTTDENATENINLFAIDNWWITDIESFVYQIPSNNSIQAIEETTVLSLSKADLEILFTKIPKLERFFRIITEHTLVAFLRKDQIYMKKNSKERYYGLIKGIPAFAQRVPQYMIASYLDITPEYLSEIRKNKN